MVASKKEVFDAIVRNQHQLRELGVRKLQLFGSTARGESTASSDLDFVIELDKNTFDSYMDVKFYLEDLFNCSVDLVLADSIKSVLRERICEEAVDAPGF
jgi:uncharacterized protein